MIPKWFSDIRGRVPASASILLGVVPLVVLAFCWWMLTHGIPEERVLSPTILPSPAEVAVFAVDSKAHAIIPLSPLGGNQAELIGRYNFTRDFFGDIRSRYRYSDFVNSEDDEVDHRYSVDVGLGYSVTRWMTLRLAYAFDKLDAINSTDDYEQNRAYVTVTLQPDQPWRLWD